MKNLQVFLDVRESLRNFLREDIGYGDITSNSVIQPNISAKLKLSANLKKQQ